MSKESLAAYKKAGEEFITLTAGLSDSELNIASAEGEWPISYIVHHLFDAQTYFATRFMNILIYDNPTIVPFDEELFPVGLNYAGRDVKASLLGLRGMHAVMEDMLSFATPEQWQRIGNHFELGAVTLEQVFSKQVEHITEHINQVQEILK